MAADRSRILALSQTYSAGVIAELLGLSRGAVAGVIHRARHGTNSRRRVGGRKPVPPYKHKTRFTRWLPPEGGVFERGR